jgi:pyruvate,water dikinase
VQEVPATWARDLDRYLLQLGRLAATDLEQADDDEVWQHALTIDALGRDYFRPNIAISIVHGVLHRTLFRLVAFIYGAKAAEQYDALTAFTELKTNLVNRDLHRLSEMIRADQVLRICCTALSAGASGRKGCSKLIPSLPLPSAAFSRITATAKWTLTATCPPGADSPGWC